MLRICLVLSIIPVLFATRSRVCVAEMVTATFEGVVVEDNFVVARPFINSVPGDDSVLVNFVAEPVVPIGSIVSGSFTFDSESDGIGTGPGSGVSFQVYPNAVASLRFIVDGTAYSQASPSSVYVSNDFLGVDRLIVGTDFPDLAFGESTAFYARLELVDNTETAFRTIELPMESSLDFFDYGVLTATWFNDASIGNLSARLHSLELSVTSVPEPGCLTLLTTTSLWFVRRRR